MDAFAPHSVAAVIRTTNSSDTAALDKVMLAELVDVIILTRAYSCPLYISYDMVIIPKIMVALHCQCI